MPREMVDGQASPLMPLIQTFGGPTRLSENPDGREEAACPKAEEPRGG